MLIVWVLVALVLALAGAGAALLYRRRSGRRHAEPTSDSNGTRTLDADPARIEKAQEPAPAIPSLEEVLGSGELGLYVPVGDHHTFLELAPPGVPAVGTPSQLPTQLARMAVTGQTGVDAMLRAGQLSGRLVTVDPATAKAIKAGTMVTDKAGDMLGIIRGESSRWSGLTRIKPVSGGLVKSASSGPAVLSAIAMQAQLANVEKAIAEVSVTVDRMWSHLQQAEQHAIQTRQELLADAHRTAVESEQMTQAIWDEIQQLGGPLREDVRKADAAVQQAVRDLGAPSAGGVTSRLRWLDETAPRLQGAVAEAAAARRALMQFSMLRLWWLTVSDDPSLASRHRQMEEQLASIPDHAEARAAVTSLVDEVSELNRLHKIRAPRKHKEVAPRADRARSALADLPWAACMAVREVGAASDTPVPPSASDYAPTGEINGELIAGRLADGVGAAEGVDETTSSSEPT